MERDGMGWDNVNDIIISVADAKLIKYFTLDITTNIWCP